MAKQSQIRWKQGDYITLGKAVAGFNRKINELNKEEKRLYLPESIKYRDIKESIATRQELNRIINNLRKFNLEGAEELYRTQAGEEITRWEYYILRQEIKVASRRLKTQYNKLKEPKYNGFSRLQMGSFEGNLIEKKLKNLNELDKKVGFEFKRLKERIHTLGREDYTMRKSIVYRENFLRELENIKRNYPEFEEIYNKLKSINNPISFFETTQKSTVLQDFFEWYITPESYASFSSSSELVDYILNEYKL